MSKTNTSENAALLLLYNNTNIANLGDATGVRGSTTPGNMYMSLHTADPGEAGSQPTSECAYSGYARVGVARSSAGWTVTASSVSPTANVDFPQAGSGANETATHFSTGFASSGAGTILHKGVIGGAQKVFTGDTSDLVTSAAHGFTTDDRVVFEAIEGLALPTGITEGTRYFVLATGLTTDAFKFSTTSGGSAVDITVAGGGLVQKSLAIVITQNVTPRLTTATAIVEG